MTRRLGRIRIVETFIREEIEVVAQVFAKMQAVVFRCEYNYVERVFYYEGNTK